MTPTRLALDTLPTYDDDGNMLAVIEAAPGARNKLKYEPIARHGKRRAAQLVEQARRVFARG